MKKERENFDSLERAVLETRTDRPGPPALRRTRPSAGLFENFAHFFPSPATIFIPSSRRLGVFSWNFGGSDVLGPSNVHVLGLSCA